MPFVNYTILAEEKDTKQLKKWVDPEEYERSLVVSNMTELESKREVVYCK